jgi:hypothetical protein
LSSGGLINDQLRGGCTDDLLGGWRGLPGGGVRYWDGAVRHKYEM